ncbi:MFS transporter [candidate division KSB1 bacterium]
MNNATSMFSPSETDLKGKRRFPWIYVPTTYFAEGIPYTIVILTSTYLYADMKMPAWFIGLTGFLYLPWVIKMFWAPMVDLYMTKRRWILTTQAIIAVLFVLTAVSLSLSTKIFIPATLTAFFLIAFFSSIHDAATDGFYMLSLTKKNQAFFVGVRSLAYRLAMWFGLGLLLIIVGVLIERGTEPTVSWSFAMGICAAVFLFLAIFHTFYLPRPHSDVQLTGKEYKRSTLYIEIFKTYFTQPKILRIMGFILLYRLGEAMIPKMVGVFLKTEETGGVLGLSDIDIGLAQGTFGLAGLIIGGLLGGWLIAKFGLRRCIWPMALALNAPNFLYILLAYYKPSFLFVCIVITIEQFGYGIGFTAFMVFLMYIAKGPFKTSHYAISTGLMGLGMMIPMMISGFLQEYLGWLNFFIAVLLLTIPGMLMIFFIPLDNDKSPAKEPASQ